MKKRGNINGQSGLNTDDEMTLGIPTPIQLPEDQVECALLWLKTGIVHVFMNSGDWQTRAEETPESLKRKRLNATDILRDLHLNVGNIRAAMNIALCNMHPQDSVELLKEQVMECELPEGEKDEEESTDEELEEESDASFRITRKILPRIKLSMTLQEVAVALSKR